MTLLLTLVPVWLAYLLGTMSPGPSNMAIMGVAMRQGRRPALALAAGVISGSLFWAIMAATGLSALLLAWSQALVAVKVVGGVYLLWLAVKAARSAFRKGTENAPQNRMTIPASKAVLYRRGLLLHLSNPKAVLVWLAILSLGAHPHAPDYVMPLMVAGCALLGVLVFGSYALVFSTVTMNRVYIKARRGIEGLFALFFGAAGIKLLLSRQ